MRSVSPRGSAGGATWGDKFLLSSGKSEPGAPAPTQGGVRGGWQGRSEASWSDLGRTDCTGPRGSEGGRCPGAWPGERK